MHIRNGAVVTGLAILLAAASAIPAHADKPIGPTETYQTESDASAVNVFVTRGDNVHWSKHAPGDINAHGWWTKTSGPATLAKVTVWLQVKEGSSWRTLNVKPKDIRPGGGKGRRTAAPYTCKNMIEKNYFRSVVDVDIIGYADGASKLTTPTQTWYCGV
ncbi:hypothetical protein GCM10023347_07500 [Streptomyces chumphonensis]|uniref:Secreted protein n=1 Tax=Streptomyces chumphonensis TaxID=1214925 RepID=A0A927ID92_9ACTN|nr:hypothetical protein [Streptomyces chumphonensis]MBD3934858.1 hypothetical protein [Streptomyces chumphonensis]